MTTNSITTNQSSNKPIYRKQLSNGISAAVFENLRDGRTYRSLSLQRSYKKDGKWNRMTLSLDHEQIPFIQEVLRSTWQFLNEHPSGGYADTSEQDNAIDISEVVLNATIEPETV